MSDDGKPVAAGESPDRSEHDAWLREALRHAPDAAAAPPVSLRDAILAEARAAAHGAAPPRGAATPSLFDRLLEFWSWLARPQVATGFASVMAATLVGMLWWDRPIDETMLPPPPASPPIAAAPAEAQKPVPAASERQLEAIAPPVAPTAGPPAPRDAAPAPAKTAPPPAAQEADATTASRSRRQEIAREAASEKADSRADMKARAASDDERAERKDRAAKPETAPAPSTASAPAAAPVTSAAPTPPAAPTPFPARAPSDDDGAGRRPAPVAAPRPAAPSPLPMEQAAPAPAVRSPAPTGALGRSPLDSAEASAGRIAAQNAADAMPRQRSALAASASRPMAPVLAALASEEARWSRRLASGESAAADAAVRAWLAQVQAAAPRWEAVADRSARRDAAASSSAAATLTLERDGRTAAIVQIEDGGVLYDPVSGPASFAPLPAEVVARLRATLPPAAR